MKKYILIETDKETNLFSRQRENGIEMFVSDHSPQTGHSINSDCKGYFVYVLSEEIIGNGEWQLELPSNKIERRTPGSYNESFYRKIIASNDPELTKPQPTMIDVGGGKNRIKESGPVKPGVIKLPPSAIKDIAKEGSLDGIIEIFLKNKKDINAISEYHITVIPTPKKLKDIISQDPEIRKEIETLLHRVSVYAASSDDIRVEDIDNWIKENL